MTYVAYSRVCVTNCTFVALNFGIIREDKVSLVLLTAKICGIIWKTDQDLYVAAK